MESKFNNVGRAVFSHGIFLFLFMIFNACEKEKENPALEATSIVAESSTSYHVEARISQKGDYKILDHGFVFGVGYTPEIDHVTEANKISLGSTIEQETFSATINLENYNYYSLSNMVNARAYITNERGTVYSKVISTALLRLELKEVSPQLAKVGDTITLSGENFGTPANINIVRFNSKNATVVSGTSTFLRVIVPSGITDYFSNSVVISVSLGQQVVQLENVFSLAASTTHFTPSSGNWYSYIVVYGSNLYNSKLYFDDIEIASPNISSNSISSNIPRNLTKSKFKIYISTNGIKSEVPGGYFTFDNFVVDPLPTLNYIPGSVLTFSSSLFNPEVGFNKLFLGSTAISSSSISYYDNKLLFVIPASLPAGNYPVMLINGADTAITGQNISIKIPTVNKMTPATGYPGTAVTFEGQYFPTGDDPAYVDFGGVTVICRLSNANKFTMNVPWLPAGEYPVTIRFNGLSISIPEKFTVVESKVVSLNPASGAAGTSILINGEGFPDKSVITVMFGNNYAEVLSATRNQINVKVPYGLTKGNWMVKVFLYNYNELSSVPIFTVL